MVKDIMDDLPSGLTISMFAGPAFTLFILIVPVICVEVTETPEATIGWKPASTSSNFAPFWKLVPVRVIETLEAIDPDVGETALTSGPLPESVVVTVVGIVIVATGTDDTET
jgi:hypothetical protein